MRGPFVFLPVVSSETFFLRSCSWIQSRSYWSISSLFILFHFCLLFIFCFISLAFPNNHLRWFFSTFFWFLWIFCVFGLLRFRLFWPRCSITTTTTIISGLLQMPRNKQILWRKEAEEKVISQWFPFSVIFFFFFFCSTCVLKVFSSCSIAHT